MKCIRKFKNLPIEFQNDTIKKYFDILNSRRISLFIKRSLDILVAAFCIAVAAPFIYLPAIIAIKLEDGGPVFYKQVRVGRYGKEYKMLKFRSMVLNADKLGSELTTDGDVRITKIGKFLRITRFDELPQFFHVFTGKMTIIGTRPEVPKFYKEYNEDMRATLLLPPGMTGAASIKYRNESVILAACDDPERVYVEKILGEKMQINIDYVKQFSILNDFKYLFLTFACLFKDDEMLNKKD